MNQAISVRDGTSGSRVMPRIAEKLESKKVRAVKVCAKAEIGRKSRHKEPRFRANVQQKLPGKRQFLMIQVDLRKIIEVVGRKLCSVTV